MWVGDVVTWVLGMIVARYMYGCKWGMCHCNMWGAVCASCMSNKRMQSMPMAWERVCVLRMCTTSVYAFIIIYMHAVCVHVHVCVLVYCACISQCVFTSWENHLWDGFPSYDTPRTRSNRGTIGWALSQALSKTVQHAKFVRGAGNNTHQELDTFKCP